MRLHRSTIPTLLPPAVLRWIQVGIAENETRVALNIEPRQVIGADTMALMAAFDKACARIWGQHWQGSLELVCDLRKGTARKWMKDGQIPPPMIVAWVAYLSARDDARVLGRLLEALALGGGMIGVDTARMAFAGLRG